MKKTLLITSALFIYGISYAQDNYSNQLERAMSQKMDSSLGTLSGQKADRKGKALEHAYTHFSKTPAAAIVEKKDFSQSYTEFRKKHNIPNYVGDAAIDTALTKDDDQKKEAVKIVETEKLLHQIYEVYHENTSADKDLKDKADVIAKQSAGILRGSMQKLSFKPNRSASSKKTVFLASGGRYFSSAAKQDNILAVKSHVVEQIRKDLVKAMSTAINSYFRGHQKSTALTKAQDTKQLVAFIKGDRQRASQTKQIRDFVNQWAKNMQRDGKKIALDKASVDSLVQHIQRLNIDANDPSKLNELMQKFSKRALINLGTNKSHLTSEQNKKINQQFVQSERGGTESVKGVFRPGVDPTRLSVSERAEWEGSLNKFIQKNYNDSSIMNQSIQATDNLNQNQIKTGRNSSAARSSNAASPTQHHFRSDLDQTGWTDAERQEFYRPWRGGQ